MSKRPAAKSNRTNDHATVVSEGPSVQSKKGREKRKGASTADAPNPSPSHHTQDDPSPISVNESNDDHAGPSTGDAANPTRSPTHTKQRTANVPKQAIKDACEYIPSLVPTDRDDDRILENLELIRATVRRALLKDSTLARELANEKQFLNNLERYGEGKFIDLVKRMADENSWEDFLGREVFFKQPISSTEPDIPATINAWGSNFEGDAADVLLKTISDYLDKEKNVYSRYSNIVNSSGTRKSRMVDQLAMEIITIPMCLREPGTRGFPPPDRGLCEWLDTLGGRTDQTDVAQKLHTFISSLLDVTCLKLQDIEAQREDIPPLLESSTSLESVEHVQLVRLRQGMLARAFREKMTKGQSFRDPNEYRTEFYRDVLDKAGGAKFTGQTRRKSPLRYVDRNQRGVREAGDNLCRFFDRHRVLDSDEGPRRPLVILAFDESHVLTDTPKNSEWTLFSELRRVLREMVNLQIFPLFLSTAGRFHLFSPETRSDPSTRVSNFKLVTLEPITEISFDDLAFSAKQDMVSLDRVVKIDWISHLGRPLFGSYYDGLQKQGKEGAILDLAKTKLLDNKSDLAAAGAPGSLACLSVRFGLELTGEGRSRDVACRQVERHMRLCLAATTGFERLVSLAGSEPFLAEAASELLRGSGRNPVDLLANHSDLHCIDRGRRGELLAALIIMQARDAAVARRSADPRERWMSVGDFMEALLPPSPFKQLQTSKPIFCHESQNANAQFQNIFRDYWMWFNHVIKVDKGDMIKDEHLWKFITRGAMIMCRDGQNGIDIILPACLKERNLSRNSVTAIMIQVKNDKKYQCSIHQTLFDKMDPLELGLFPDTENSRPVVRIVFALASNEAVVKFPEAGVRCYPDKFTSFDIWCAGLSAHTFGFIGNDLEPYKELLDRSLRPHDAFELKEIAGLNEESRVAQGIQRRRMAALATEDPRHDAIHV